jgi:hypothetical protein
MLVLLVLVLLVLVLVLVLVLKIRRLTRASIPRHVAIRGGHREEWFGASAVHVSRSLNNGSVFRCTFDAVTEWLRVLPWLDFRPRGGSVAGKRSCLRKASDLGWIAHELKEVSTIAFPPRDEVVGPNSWVVWRHNLGQELLGSDRSIVVGIENGKECTGLVS